MNDVDLANELRRADAEHQRLLKRMGAQLANDRDLAEHHHVLFKIKVSYTAAIVVGCFIIGAWICALVRILLL